MLVEIAISMPVALYCMCYLLAHLLAADPGLLLFSFCALEIAGFSSRCFPYSGEVLRLPKLSERQSTLAAVVPQ